MFNRAVVCIAFVVLFAADASAQSRQPPATENERVEGRNPDRRTESGQAPPNQAQSQPLGLGPPNEPADHDKGGAEREERETRNLRAQETIAFAALSQAVLLFLTLGAAVFAGWQSRKAAIANTQTAQLARDQLTLTFPPRLRVTRLILWAHPPEGVREDRYAPPDFTPGQRIDGVAWVINYGREIAYIKDWDCAPRFLQSLPMNPPYRLKGEERAPLCVMPAHIEVEKLEPGEMARFEYSFTVPADFNWSDDEKRFFVIGRVTFRDRLDTHRAVFFARRYRFKRQSFSRVKHPEYECEE